MKRRLTFGIIIVFIFCISRFGYMYFVRSSPGAPGKCPFVVKREIILGAAKFLRRDRLVRTCEEQVTAGYRPANANISSIVVHELGHHLMDVYTATQFGFEGYYVTEENHAPCLTCIRRTYSPIVSQSLHTL